MADAARYLPATAQRLRDARAKHGGGAQHDLAAEVEQIRTARGLRTERTRVVKSPNHRRSRGAEIPARCGARCWPMPCRTMKTVYSALLLTPPCLVPLLVQTPVNSDVLGVILAQRAAHIRAEHLFGPDYARDLVDRDLTTIEELIPVTPHNLRYDVRRAAGRIAELGGWIAQDSGDPIKADQLTVRAEDHLRAADPALRAMIWMRRSNIQLRSDPELAVELAADAARLIDGLSVGRLQRALPVSRHWPR